MKQIKLSRGQRYRIKFWMEPMENFKLSAENSTLFSYDPPGRILTLKMESGCGSIRIFEGKQGDTQRHDWSILSKMVPTGVKEEMWYEENFSHKSALHWSGTPVFGSGFWVALPVGVQGDKGADRCRSTGDRPKPWRCAKNPLKSQLWWLGRLVNFTNYQVLSKTIK